MMQQEVENKMGKDGNKEQATARGNRYMDATEIWRKLKRYAESQVASQHNPFGSSGTILAQCLEEEAATFDVLSRNYHHS
jgi:hypothetical protein